MKNPKFSKKCQKSCVWAPRTPKMCLGHVGGASEPFWPISNNFQKIRFFSIFSKKSLKSKKIEFSESGQKLAKFVQKHPPHAPNTFWDSLGPTHNFSALFGTFRDFHYFHLKKSAVFKVLSKPDFSLRIHQKVVKSAQNQL